MTIVDIILSYEWQISGPPREARQPRLGPWLDFEKYKMAATAEARQ
jgi:hypothetical protein